MKLALRNSNNLYSLENRLENLFDEFFTPLTLSSYEKETPISPAVELLEEEKNYILKAEIPGIKKEELDIQVQEESITISGEFKNQTEEKGKNLYKSEFRYGKFTRSLPLPEKINNKKASAQYENGILSITLPKLEEDTEKIVRLKI